MESGALAVSATDVSVGRALPKAPLSAWYGLFVLVMTTLFAFVDRQILNLVGPSLQTSLGFTDFQRSEEHTFELQSLMRISYAVFCLKKKKNNNTTQYKYTNKKHLNATKL